MDKVQRIITNLHPTTEDFDLPDYTFEYWNQYSEELDDIQWVYVAHGDDDLISYLNHVMKTEQELSPRYHAAVDVATTLEDGDELFSHKFKYDKDQADTCE